MQAASMVVLLCDDLDQLAAARLLAIGKAIEHAEALVGAVRHLHPAGEGQHRVALAGARVRMRRGFTAASALVRRRNVSIEARKLASTSALRSRAA